FRSTSTQVKEKPDGVIKRPYRDGVTADGITQRKYNYIRAEQLFRAEKGLRLLDDASVPVLPKFGDDRRHSPEIQAFIEQMEAKQ
ncbi:type II secretion system protein GspD, partial [Vibrio cholerae O1 biovar El Tor]|nr:type II secretion system protein GspD [Vibrio cholerae O1 biovar El Tor]